MISDRERAALDPDCLRLLNLFETGIHAPLLHEVDQQAKQGPLSTGTLAVASLTLTALARYQEAYNAARTAIAQDPDQAWIYGVLAAAETGRGHRDQAIAAQRYATRLAPAEPTYAAMLTRYLREDGQHGEAAEAARKGLKLHPAHAGLLNELGLVLLATDDYQGALDQFRQSQTADPCNPEGYESEGLLHLRTGDRREARRALRQALRCQPDRFETENLMASSLTGRQGPFWLTIKHMLDLARVRLIGWCIIAFLYYVTFRMLEMLWNQFPATLPYARILLLLILVYLIGLMLLGRILRLLFRTAWPR